MSKQRTRGCFIICSVLAQVAIDSCKRNFEVRVGAELARIEKLSCMKHDPRYPVFYADVQKYNNKKKKGNRLRIKESDIVFLIVRWIGFTELWKKILLI